jgi:hypothetical protein
MRCSSTDSAFWVTEVAEDNVTMTRESFDEAAHLGTGYGSTPALVRESGDHAASSAMATQWVMV